MSPSNTSPAWAQVPFTTPAPPWEQHDGQNRIWNVQHSFPTAKFPNRSVQGNIPSPLNYFIDRGDRKFSRLIPVDTLPPLVGIPPLEEEHTDMVILPPIESMQSRSKQPLPSSHDVQNQIDHIGKMSPAKAYCYKWIHEGVCALGTQQRCMFKHQMPQDRTTQRFVGLENGFPLWWKKIAQDERSRRLHSQDASSPMRAKRTAPHLTNRNGY